MFVKVGESDISVSNESEERSPGERSPGQRSPGTEDLGLGNEVLMPNDPQSC